MSAAPSLARPAFGPKRSAAVQSAIVEAAASLVAERGYMATSLEAIAERAGAGKQTIYRWWGTKPQLFMEVYEALVPLEAVAIEADCPLATLLARVEALFQIYGETPAGQILAGLVVEAQANPDFGEGFRQRFVVERCAVLRQPLVDAKAAGALPPDHDLDLTVELLVSAIWYRLLMRDKPLDQAFARDLLRRLIGDTL